MRLPERDLVQAEVETFWGRDRSALRSCRDRHQALAIYERIMRTGVPK